MNFVCMQKTYGFRCVGPARKIVHVLLIYVKQPLSKDYASGAGIRMTRRYAYTCKDCKAYVGHDNKTIASGIYG